MDGSSSSLPSYFESFDFKGLIQFSNIISNSPPCCCHPICKIWFWPSASTHLNSKWQLYHDCYLADINHKMHPYLWKVKKQKKKKVVLELMKYHPCWWISYLFLAFQYLSWALKVPVSRCLLKLLGYLTGISNLSRSYLTDWFLILNLPSPQKQNNLSCSSISQSVQLVSRVRLFVTPWTAACQASLSITNSRSPPKPVSIEPSNHLILCCLSPSPPALNLSQHQGLFQWVSSSHQVAKVLEFQL